MNLGGGRFAYDTTGRLPTLYTNARGGELADIDNDGDLDALIYNDDSDDILLLNDGTGRFTDGTQGRLPAQMFSDSSRVVVFGDLDGDGFADLVRGGWDTTSFTLMNDGTGAFRGGQTLGNWRTHDIQLADIDGDGDLDVWVCGEVSGDRLWLNVGAGQFVDVSSRLAGLLGPGTLTGSRSAAFADYDEDGDLDVVLGTRTWTGTGQVYVGPVLFENDGTGHFTNITLTSMSGISVTCNSVASADFDLDGDVDVALLFGSMPFTWTEHNILFNLKRHARFAPTAARGTSLPLELYAESSHTLLPILGVAGARIATPYGVLGIDPSVVASLPLTLFPTTGRQDIVLSIPNRPSLAGLRFWAQALDVWTDAGSVRAHFTNVTGFRIL